MLTLVKFEELKSMLTLEKDGIEFYPSLRVLIESVYAAFEAYTGRNFELDDYVEIVPFDGKLVPLRALPIVAVTEVLVDGVPLVVSECRVRVHHLELPYSAKGDATVTYEGGLETATGDLKRAALLQILHEWQRRDAIGATNTTNEGGSTSWPELALLKEVRRVLSPLVHPAKMI